MLTPEVVFTTKIPLGDQNVYSPRRDPENKLIKAMARGDVALVFGEYGVGKTSIVRRILRDRYSATHKSIYIPNVAGKEIDEIFGTILEEIGYRIQKTRTISTSEEKSPTIGASGLGLSFSISAKRTSSSQIGEELVITHPTDRKMLDLCEEHHVVLVLDELHRASASLAESIVVLVKAIDNLRLSHFRLILLGTSSSASNLVRRDPGIDRALVEIEVERMTDHESIFLVEKGMSNLAIMISDVQTQSIVRKGVGSPYVLQYICLEVAANAFHRPSRTVENDDIARAIDEYLMTRASRLKDQYLKAISTIGAKKYRNHVLHAMALSKDDYVTMDEITGYVSRELGEDVPSTTLSGPLRDLKNEEYGSILKDVEKADNKRAYNYTTFTDPAMKTFIRMYLERDK